MCGIAGYAGFSEPGLLARMCDAIRHRGPDGEGYAELPKARIAIGMRRLAIIDLVTGDQPFVSKDGRVHLVFNGEIYNYLDVQAALRARGHIFHTRSDTEVVLEAYLEWGHEAWLRLHGMFAIAIADQRGDAPELIIVRDRVGMKPVYMIERDGKFLFASELKALMVWSGFSSAMSSSAVFDYLRNRYVPGPGTLFEDVRKLASGHMLRYRLGQVSIERWWAPPLGEGLDEVPAAEAAERFGSALRDAVRRHMISDVPVGAYLSGGIDSNAIVALMAEFTSDPVKTFSIGFPDFPQDEIRRAEVTAQVFQTDHQEIECRAADMNALPDIVWSLDEPIGDAIVVPMSVLAREARRKVKVVLTGDGADEILGGYMFHRKLVQIERLRRLLPKGTWPLVASLVRTVPAFLLDRVFDYPGSFGTEGRRKLVSLIYALQKEGIGDLRGRSASLLDSEDIALAMLPRAAELMRTSSVSRFEEEGCSEVLSSLIRMEFQHWLPDLMLNKLDKLTMAHSLEGRVPYMDEAVIRAAARVPSAQKLTTAVNKKVLRDFASTILPDTITHAPKAAFYIPMESYMRSPEMISLVRHTLNPTRIARRGLFRPEWVESLLRPHPNAGFLPLKRLFSVMMLELWFERFCPDASWA